MRYLRHIAVLALGVVLVPGVAACGGGGKSHSPSSSPSAGSSDSAVAQITANWQEFFDGKTPADRRIQLLQNGQQFASIIQAVISSGLASQASAKVSSVTLTSPTEATVTYSIIVGGTPALTDQTGTAVLEDGVWKVGVSSFCGLAALENGGSTSGLPAPCVSPS